MSSPTRVEFRQVSLEPDLVRRAAAFAAAVALLNRNRNYCGQIHAPVTLVTDDLTLVTAARTVDLFANQSSLLGTCWAGSEKHGGTLIWLNHVHPVMNVTRGTRGLVETLVHELAHAYTQGKHGWTFRRMYALLQPHICELFDVYRRADDVREVIYKYQREHLTERDTESDGYRLINRYDRADEEFTRHMVACRRMEKRLQRLELRP